MSGFDEGRVYTSETLPGEGQAEQRGGRISRAEAGLKFAEFLRNFHSTGQVQRRKYGDALLENKKYVRVDLQDLNQFDTELGRCLTEWPDEYFPVLEAAAQRVLQQFHNRDEDGQQPEFTDLQVLLYSSKRFGPNSIRELTSESVSQLVMIPGIVTAASRPRHKATLLTLMCKDCKAIKRIPCRRGFGGVMIPRNCENTQQAVAVGQEACSLDPYVVLPTRTQCVDQQTLKLQERPEDVPTGELPRIMQLLLDRRMVGTMAPGTRVTAVGIYAIVQGKQNNKKEQAKGGVAIQQPYLRVLGIEEEAEGARDLTAFTPEEEAEFKAFATQPELLKLLAKRIAPSIFGHDNIKKAVACLLFGGARKRLPDGTFRRGDINVLLIGDPSTAKSQFLKFASQTAPIAVYTSGKGSSAAGLTASVIKDNHGEFYLEGGAMVLADEGVVCIDEFDKMRPEDRVAIHEAMEQQTISIAKAGITTMLRSRTSVLAAANPPSGRYDDLKSAQENLDLQTTILSRFDLIFIVKDERTDAHDKMIANHVLKIHQNAADTQGPDPQREKEELFLKRYLKYCRTRCFPRLDAEAGQMLVANYLDMRRRISGSMVEEVQAIEVQILRRIAINSSLPTSRLVDELARTGISKANVERAIVYLVKKDDLKESHGKVKSLRLPLSQRLACVTP
ncbi:hypothetical protein WJX73_003912 [Symbiochloris irregularis]|uniref:DNA replication licensing factor MCM5 n=1 Tax=Symbiochloris irregularis TaxID=706552 RepID=A0AAW1PQK6_9CHLO